MRPLHNSSIVIAVSQSPELSEGAAKQSHNALISHEIAASLCSSNDQNWAKVGVMQRSQYKDCHTHCRAFAMTNEDCDTVSTRE